MTPRVVMHNPRERRTHSRKPEAVSGRNDTKSEPSFPWGEPSLNHSEHRGPHACGSNSHNGVEKACRPEGVDGPHKDDADPQNQSACGNDTSGTEAVCEIAAEGCDGEVGEKVRIIDGADARSAESKVADHFRHYDAVTDANGIVDEEIYEDSGENDPGPVKTPSRSSTAISHLLPRQPCPALLPFPRASRQGRGEKQSRQSISESARRQTLTRRAYLQLRRRVVNPFRLSRHSRSSLYRSFEFYMILLLAHR